MLACQRAKQLPPAPTVGWYGEMMPRSFLGLLDHSPATCSVSCSLRSASLRNEKKRGQFTRVPNMQSRHLSWAIRVLTPRPLTLRPFTKTSKSHLTVMATGTREQNETRSMRKPLTLSDLQSRGAALQPVSVLTKFGHLHYSQSPRLAGFVYPSDQAYLFPSHSVRCK
ncbi:hypothetical protein BGW80DRAFT_1306049 [Lactifluus volemus]|nr:hypothetical protein BGW80DRAFT_1306049 [Lactifluus volemus]